MADAPTLLDERKKMIDNVYKHEHNSRVPLASNIWSWSILDCGYKLKEALFDYDTLERINAEFHERYQFDVYCDILSRNPQQVNASLGGGTHIIDDDKDMIYIDDKHFIEDDEWGEFIADPRAFYWSKIFKRYCKPGTTFADMEKAVEESKRFGEYYVRQCDIYNNKYGVLLETAHVVQTPMERVFSYLRGISKTAIDLRKNKEQLKEALEVIYEMEGAKSLAAAMVEDSPGCVAPITNYSLQQSILSVKQYEELDWPYMKKTIDAAIAHNKRIFVFMESSMLRFAEFFEEVPKGLMLMQLEQDDIFEVRKRLPNIALMGGMPSGLLGKGTKQECVDYAKRLIDELGDGFVLCQDKMISYRNDATRENLLAVNDFAREYSY